MAVFLNLLRFASYLVHFLFLIAYPHNQVRGHSHEENFESKSFKSCNYFYGSWIYDNSSYPLYNLTTCPFIGSGFDCQKNGRPDDDYLKYRWKPAACDLPRFDGRIFLERHRGKKILFVGDSLSFNMWESLRCMIHTAVPNSNYTITKNTFTIPEYGVSIGILKNGFLVDLVYDKVVRILKLDSISRGDPWKQADVLIFNSYHWWIHSGKYRTWDYYQVGNKILKDMDPMEAYKIAMTTWARWTDQNVNPLKTKVFFQGVSAMHLNAKDWDGTGAKGCAGETEPVEGSKYPGPGYQGETILKCVISKMKSPVYLLDITLLTQLRKDGHPSMYTGNKALNDCSHWCIAGVPDTWNQLLYTVLLEN